MIANVDPVAFLLWCGVVNYAVLLASFVAWLALRGPMRRLHRQWFDLADAQVDGFVYVFFGLYKLGIWFFLLIPGLVLHFMTR